MFWFHSPRPRKLMWGLFWILLGIFLLLSNHGLLGYHFSLSRDWPILLIAWGLMKIVDLVAWRDGRPYHKFKVVRGQCGGGHGTTADQGKMSDQERSEILQAVAEGRMSAEEAARKIRGA